MKKNIAFILCVISLVYGSYGQSKKFFSTRGKQIIAPNGTEFLIRGTNLGNWLVPEGYMFRLGQVSSARLINQAFTELIGKVEADRFWKNFLDNYITENDIIYLKSVGINSLRLPFNYRLFTRENYMGANDDQRGFTYFDKLIGWCRKQNISIILDMHCAPGGQTGDNIDDGYGYPFLYDSEADQQLTVKIWTKIAARYKNEPMILGYDLLNEPIATYFDPNLFNSKLELLYKRITKAIRSVDKNHIIILGGAQWDSNFKIFGAPFDNNLVYTFHKYWTPATQSVIQDYIDFGKKYNVPIYCGETGENTDSWVDSFRVVLEKNHIGWHFWPYKKPNNTRGFVQFQTPASYDSVISYAEKNRSNFEMIRAARPKDMQQIKIALDQYINNSRFKNCTPNKGYISALGLKPEDIN